MAPHTNGSTSYKKVLTTDTINPAVLAAKYAVRGELALRANELTDQLTTDRGNELPFKDVVHCEIGNPQALDQKPLTFFRQVPFSCISALRQVLALMEYPDLLKDDKIEITKQLFPQDAIDRAKLLKQHIKSVGAYSMSQGIPYIRGNVANFIAGRLP